MRATIVFDNTTTDIEMKAGWGFACVVEINSHRILFDTGEDGLLLIENMTKLKIDPAGIDTIFISHNHYDHIGGLPEFLAVNPAVKIFSPPSLPDIKNAGEIIYLNKPTSIFKNVYSTGELAGIEQSLVVDTRAGLIIFTGCSHPGMKKILSSARKFGDIYGVIGGLHDFNQFELFKNLKLICATHCTRYQQELQSLFPHTYLEGGVGRIIEVA